MAVVVEACSSMKVVYNWLYLTALVGFLICKHEVSGFFSPNITRPERGSGLRISCFLSAASGQVNLYSDNLKLSLTVCLTDKGPCIPAVFRYEENIVYTFGVTNGSVWVDILSLNRTRDQGLWHCFDNLNQQNKKILVLTVYGSPGGVSLVTPLPPVVELAEISIMLQCKTDSCAYPEPSIMWYYQKGPNPISLSTGMIRRSNSSENCIQQELIHYSSLELSRGTNFPGNIPMTVNLLCGTTHLSLNGTKFSTISNNVIFAVSLMFVNISGKTDVTQGVQANFTCITSISRPHATVTWFIGTTEITSGIHTINSTDGNGSPFVESRLTINPDSLIHHGKEIFCQAFTPFDLKTSDKLVLYVKVSLMFVNISGKTNVTQGVQANFTCITSISRPHATVIWFEGTTEITSGIQTNNSTDGNGSPFVESRLTIRPNSLIHHGKEIFCQAFTPFNNVTSDKLVLYVKVSVTEITLENSTAGTFVFYDGFLHNLKCTSSPSRPSPTIKWMLELQTGSITLPTDNITNTDVINVDFLYVRTSEITLTLKKEIRNCKIFCSGNIDSQQIAAQSSKVTIDVWYMPNKPEVQEYGAYFPWLENQIGTLICNSSDYGNPTSNVSWTSNRGITDAKGHLVIIELAWSDHRNMVSCQLVNRYTIDKDVHAVSESINLNVEYSPRIQFNTISPLTVNETQSLSVLCNATGNPNPNQTVWSVRRDPDGSLLRFENISRNDNGTYMCNATANSAKYGTLRNQMEFNIIVQYAPVMNVTNVTSTLQDTTCLITCAAIGFPVLYTFHPWKHMWGETSIRSNLKGIPSGNTSASQNILKLERLSLQDMGTYVCSAENRIKGINGEFNQTAAVDLNILGVPAFLSEENKQFAGGIGHFINISIPFYSYSNVTSFMFKRNGTAVMNTSRINTHLRSAVIDYKLHDRNIQLRAQEAFLYIQNLTREDFDNYTLILENPQGLAEFIVALDPFGPPLMVLSFYFNRVGDQVELYFDPGFNGGRIQEFVIQYKSETSLEEWKNASILQETETQYRLPNGTFVVTITKPSPGSYIYRIYSWNEIGRSPYSLEIRVFIPEGIKPPQVSSQVVAIAGGIGAAVLVIVLATIVIVVIKRRNQSYDETSRREINERTESGLIDNPVYDTSDTMPSPSTSTSAVGTEYAVVVKSKHDQKVAKTEDPSNVYAQVEKKKMKTNKNGASKGKLGKAARGDIYENATIVKGNTSRENVYENSKSVKLDSSSENMYENPAATSGKGRRVNKDDLHYADLMLAAPTTKAGKSVIHGLENRTEYAEIAYGKRGKPLPESEDEEESGCPKKDN